MQRQEGRELKMIILTKQEELERCDALARSAHSHRRCTHVRMPARGSDGSFVYLSRSNHASCVLTFSRFALCVLLDPTHRLKVEYESLVKVKAEQESMMAKLTESM